MMDVLHLEPMSPGTVAVKREFWEQARQADRAWSAALAHHRRAKPLTPGMGHRLRDTAEAARQVAEIAEVAPTAGFGYARLAPVPEGADVLPGELDPEYRWLSHRWVTVAQCEEAAAAAFRGDSFPAIVTAMHALADALQLLAAEADERFGTGT